MRNPTPHEALRRLDVFVGTWELWALNGEAGPVRSHFAWLEGGAFLVQRTDMEPGTSLPPEWAPHVPFPTVTVSGYDDTAGEFTTLYADGRGVARVYGMSLRGDEWRQWRSAEGFHQRFTATIGDGGDTVTGGWELSKDGATWEWDFDVTYRRVG